MKNFLHFTIFVVDIDAVRKKKSQICQIFYPIYQNDPCLMSGRHDFTSKIIKFSERQNDIHDRFLVTMDYPNIDKEEGLRHT